MRLNWRNVTSEEAGPQGSKYAVPTNHEHAGHVSKSQRKYKVRFRRDRGATRATKSRPPGLRSISSAVLEVDHAVPVSTADAARRQVENQPQGSVLQSDQLDARRPEATGMDLELGTVEGASLLYAFSTEHRWDEDQGDPTITWEPCTSPMGDDSPSRRHVGFTDSRLRDADGFSTTVMLETPSVSSTNQQSPQLSFQADILPNIPCELPAAGAWSGERTSERRFYLQYYIEKVVPRLMPLWNTPDNPFLCIVIPASTESEILMQAIMALSSHQLSLQRGRALDHLLNPPGDEYNGLKALRHKQKVLTLLRENLAKPDLLRDDATLAACMLMQTFEVLHSGTSGWDHWLKGATLFIQLRGKLESDLKDSNSWVRLAKCVVAIETFAATSTRFDLLVAEQYWNIYRRLRQDDLRQVALGRISGLKEDPDDEHFQKLVGCPVVVVYSLGRMVMLAQSREETEATSNMQNDAEWHSTWSIESVKLEDLLLRWRPRSGSQPDEKHLAEAFRHAALVFYYRKIRKLDYCHETVQYHVRQTFINLESLTPSSYIEGIALWPTMMAALAINENDAAMAKKAIKRIRGMSSHVRDPLYQNAEEALKLLWTKRRESKTWEERIGVDWNELSEEMDWKWCWV
ncbi:fungal-specific transcription factor domain-containing protein [Exophiala viscosa]|uniref:Fungal-specific transcription factor domain-containing protein n=1 Tax=Exophiala viscosa TaxID=2486360 RepID=A0AAN6DKH1_9EURO|nr:fungal-specific transcription factor domain-containing protein [Exophiala viscosa]